MKILWMSNGPNGQSGYANQTKLFTPRIHARDEHDVMILCTHGREFSMAVNGDGIVEIPPYLADRFANASIPAHVGFHKRDVVISLIDPFVLTSENWSAVNWCAWSPIDCAPAQHENIEALGRARWVWSMSKFGHEQLQKAGFDPMYVPHGIDTKAYRPVDRGEARAALGQHLKRDLTDAFLVVTVAANVGSPSRKNFAGMIEAFARFAETQTNAVWYIHTEPNGRQGGDDLRAMVEAAGIEDRVHFPADYNYLMGLYGPDYLNRVYNAGDVFLLLSGGEGFGLPIMEAQAAGCPVIVTDGTAMAELCLAGGKVDALPVQAWQGRFGSRWWRADVESAAAHLRAAVDWDHEAMRAAARAGSLAYDVDYVFQAYMLPALRRMADDLTPKTVAARGDGHAIDVSVIIPTYNGAATIRQAVETALEADGVEVIVADDGSTDETPTVLEQLQAAHGARLTVVTLPENCGQVEAQNAALDAACGTWILFIGDDDWIDPDGLREMVARANEAGDGVGFVYGAMQYHGMRDDIVRPKRYNRAQFTRHFPAGVSCIWRREIAAAHGIRYRAFGDNKTGQPSDFDLILQIIKAGYDGLAVPDVLVCHHTLAGDRGTAWLHANQDAGLLARFREEHPEFVGRL